MYNNIEICGFHCAVDSSGTVIFRSSSKSRTQSFIDANKRQPEFYHVIVANVGTIYTGNSKLKALNDFKECCDLSALNYGRFSGEDVTLMCDDEIVKEYAGTINENNCD